MYILVLGCYAFPLSATGGGRILGIPGAAVIGLPGAAHPPDSCGIGFIGIVADLESQLYTSSEVPQGCFRFLPDRRMQV